MTTRELLRDFIREWREDNLNDTAAKKRNRQERQTLRQLSVSPLTLPISDTEKGKKGKRPGLASRLAALAMSW